MNNSYAEVEARVSELLARYLQSSGHPELKANGPITGSTNLVSDFTMDSFQVMEFLMELEESFDVMIDMNSLSNTHTVEDLSKVIQKLLQE